MTATTTTQVSIEETDTAHLRAGAQITMEEIGVHLSGVVVLLRQLARAAEHARTFARLAAIVDGDVPVAAAFPGGDPWGAAARGQDRETYGGPAVVPTVRQLLWLAYNAAHFSPERRDDIEHTTYAEAMNGISHRGWESKAAQARRRSERDAEVRREVLRILCERCGATDGEHCRTTTGRVSEQAHKGRQREAEANVDARLGYLGDNPVHVDTE
ncbi:zinc finger domain-containing protein [Streptomyces boluensis]|uniref:DNA-binding phage zinc finger domain-containing protein n=1 Tax=Streptomyces boluensis TaxID=1775135 RepID=A0A964UT30_9ACTN|nr:hypothetical protein [Streptomyces boluensis]NBE53971.1 hypothetical protein [Streptomyces boluensis]